MLNISRVTKRYRKLVANDNVNIEVQSGQISVLLGPNGAGKSTLIKCVAGLLRFEGTITFDGKLNSAAEAKAQLGYVPEMPAVYDLLTVDEHLEFIRRAYRVTGNEDYADSLLERFELTDKRNKLGKELSKGMQQKLSIICALSHRPKLLVLDEPMVGLDPHAIREIKQIFRELKSEGRTVLISTHMLDSVEDYWDTTHIMMNGKVAASRDNVPGEAESLEQLFFDITERKPEPEVPPNA